MSILVVAEHDNVKLSGSTLATITASLKIHPKVTTIVIGYQCNDVAEELAQYEGVGDVIVFDDIVYQYQLAENTAELIADYAKDYQYFFAPATTFGKNLMPRVAGLLNVGQISDITDIINENTFVRPIYAGNAFETVESLDAIKIITVRTVAFNPISKGANKAPIKKESRIFENKLARFVERKLTKSERPELTAARIVISGGRGLQNAENFKLLEQLATQLGAAIGASRAAVDAGFVPNDYQVGQTGKVVAPELYIAVGISGAIQHLAGMKDSKIIVAINKDPDAPIFAVADYGLVGDLFKVLPELQQALTQIGYTS